MYVWEAIKLIAETPGAAYLGSAVAVVGVSLYIQHKQRLAGKDTKVVKGFTLLGLGFILVECFMDMIHHAASFLL
jgi:hypothetical protein